MEVSIRGTHTLILSKIITKAMSINVRLNKENAPVKVSVSRSIGNDFTVTNSENGVNVYLKHDRLKDILADNVTLSKISSAIRVKT